MPYTPRDIVVRLKRAGFAEVRQTGAHLFLRHDTADYEPQYLNFADENTHSLREP